MPDHVTLDDLRERIAAHTATKAELAAARAEHGQGGPIYGIERRLQHLEERVREGVRGLSPEDVAQQYEAIMGVVAESALTRRVRHTPAVQALVTAVLEAHRDDLPPRIRDLAEAARGEVSDVG